MDIYIDCRGYCSADGLIVPREWVSSCAPMLCAHPCSRVVPPGVVLVSFISVLFSIFNVLALSLLRVVRLHMRFLRLLIFVAISVWEISQRERERESDVCWIGHQARTKGEMPNGGCKLDEGGGSLRCNC